MLTRFLSAIVFLVFCGAFAHAERIHGVGMKKLELLDPVAPNPVDAVAFFPSPESTGETSIGPYRIAASRSAPIAKNSYPLILLSHGNMGSLWGHHDLATFLARQGFIVISITHPGDNFQDTSRVGAVSSVYGRPLQISAAINAALKDPILAGHINPQQIGFAGFSAGGTTGLILAGAKPAFHRLEDYCAGRANDRNVCEAGGRIRTDRADLLPAADPRIGAFVLLAPLSVVFSPEELKRITRPMLIFVGENDEELSPAQNALALMREIKDVATLETIKAAGHFTFLAPCSSEMSRAMPALCNDPQNVDRVEIHRIVNARILDFFGKTLSLPQP